MLSGGLSYIDGARQIVGNSFSAGLDHDPNIRVFKSIDSDSDAFPIGRVRTLWSSEALQRLQPEIDELETWARENAETQCQALIEELMAQP